MELSGFVIVMSLSQIMEMMEWWELKNGASLYMIKSYNLKKIFKEHATNLITSDNTSAVIYGKKSFVL